MALQTDGGTFLCVASQYCSTKINSLGCIPQISGSGQPALSAPGPYLIQAQPALNAKKGLLFYGTTGGASLPMAGGVLA